VRLHGGTLTIDSAPGRGTRVTVRLPAPAVAAEAAA
jgi:signal transduction histidine kinase